MNKKIYIQYNCIAHYRARIFELLTNNSEYDFTVVADNEADTPFMATVNDLGDRKIRHIVAKTYQIKLPGLPIFYFQPNAINMTLKDKPDLVIALGSPYSITAWLLLLICKLLRIPVLLWGHGLLGGETGLKWWVRKVFYKLASGQLLYGNYAKKLLIDKGFPASTLHVVYNSLDYDNQVSIYKNITQQMKEEFRESLEINNNDRLIIFTGRLQPVKRLDMIIDAIGILHGKGITVHVAFIGEGQERSKLADLAKRNDITDQVHFLGASYDENYLGLALSSSDLCVIPSGAGLSIMHSMVFGTPVLIHDEYKFHFPEWEAVVDKKTGLYYKYGSIDDLAQKMEEALYPQPLKQSIEQNCLKMIDRQYNPHIQEKIFVESISHYLKDQSPSRKI